MRSAGVVIEVCGDKACPDYRTTDAGLVRDTLIDRGLSVASVRRSFNTIKAIFNLVIAEHGLEMRNPFASIFMPEGDSKKRVSIPVETIREIQQSCYAINDDMRWLVAPRPVAMPAGWPSCRAQPVCWIPAKPIRWPSGSVRCWRSS